jgi:hypothetical protein
MQLPHAVALPGPVTAIVDNVYWYWYGYGTANNHVSAYIFITVFSNEIYGLWRSTELILLQGVSKVRSQYHFRCGRDLSVDTQVLDAGNTKMFHAVLKRRSIVLRAFHPKQIMSVSIA